MDMIP